MLSGSAADTRRGIGRQAPRRTVLGTSPTGRRHSRTSACAESATASATPPPVTAAGRVGRTPPGEAGVGAVSRERLLIACFGDGFRCSVALNRYRLAVAVVGPLGVSRDRHAPCRAEQRLPRRFTPSRTGRTVVTRSRSTPGRSRRENKVTSATPPPRAPRNTSSERGHRKTWRHCDPLVSLSSTDG